MYASTATATRAASTTCTASRVDAVLDLFLGDVAAFIVRGMLSRAYEGEESLVETLFGVVKRMSNFVEVRRNTVRIPNPVHPSENFADRWQGDERKAQAFLHWLSAAQKLQADLVSVPPDRLGDVLGRLLGESAGHTAMNKFASRQGASSTGIRTATSVLAAPTPKPGGLRGALASVLDLLRAAPHRVHPPWEMRSDGTTVAIRGWVTGGNAARRGEFSSGQPILPNADLRFDANIRGTSDADIYWQVTNTGPEAERARQMRGGFEPGNASKVESSRYRGDHSIECFLVRGRTCIARSGEFVVAIRS